VYGQGRDGIEPFYCPFQKKFRREHELFYIFQQTNILVSKEFEKLLTNNIYVVFSTENIISRSTDIYTLLFL
jgi:hypothetical protein